MPQVPTRVNETLFKAFQSRMRMGEYFGYLVHPLMIDKSILNKIKIKTDCKKEGNKKKGSERIGRYR